MTFRQLAYRSVRGNWHRYSAFFLSSAFSVMIFFLYTSFIFHPDVVNGQIQAAAKVRQGLVACDMIVLIFSFFFVLYSNSAFLTSRKKEFGLLLLFGMTPNQLRRLILYENAMIGLLAIGVGIGFGALFSKLFFMALAQLLGVDNPIRFYVPPEAVLVTAAGFFLLFQLMTAASLFQVGKSPIVQLLKAAQQPKTPPLVSRWLALLSFASLSGGYALAWNMTSFNVIAYMLPVLFLVTFGTYFLFTQLSVAGLGRLAVRKGVYYRRTNLLAISSLAFKMKDNARTLFLVAILSAVVMTATCTVYVFNQSYRDQMVQLFPQAILVVEKGASAHRVIHPDKVKEILAQHGVRVVHELHVTGVPVRIALHRPQERQLTLLAVAEADYNREAARLGRERLLVAPGHAVLTLPFRGMETLRLDDANELVASAGGRQQAFRLDGQNAGTVFNPIAEATYLLVVNDADLHRLMTAVPDEDKAVVYGWELDHWESAYPAVQAMIQLVPKQERERFTTRIEPYVIFKQSSSLTLFIGVFISVLFFLASGSMIYFRLFTELEDDRGQFRALMRIGMTFEEIRRVVSLQAGTIFFVPCAVGIVHTLFAMKSLGNIWGGNIWPYAALIILLFLALQTVYFLAARRVYVKQIVQQVG